MPFLNQALHYYHATLLPALSFLHVMLSSVKQLPALSPRASSFRRLLQERSREVVHSYMPLPLTASL